MYQTGFGAGRSFAKFRTHALDYFGLVWTTVCELFIDLLAFAGHPSWDWFLRPFARTVGIVAGVRSYKMNNVVDPEP